MSFKIENKDDTFKRLLAVDYKSLTQDVNIEYISHMNIIKKQMQKEITSREEDNTPPSDFIQFDLKHLKKLFSDLFKRIIEVQGHLYLQYLNKNS